MVWLSQMCSDSSDSWLDLPWNVRRLMRFGIRTTASISSNVNLQQSRHLIKDQPFVLLVVGWFVGGGRWGGSNLAVTVMHFMLRLCNFLLWKSVSHLVTYSLCPAMHASMVIIRPAPGITQTSNKWWYEFNDKQPCITTHRTIRQSHLVPSDVVSVNQWKLSNNDVMQVKLNKFRQILATLKIASVGVREAPLTSKSFNPIKHFRKTHFLNFQHNLDNIYISLHR